VNLNKKNKEKNLIYFTLGNNVEYIKLAKLCVSSLYRTGYDGDFLFITDLENELIEQIDFKKKPHFLVLDKSELLGSSSNKLKIYLFEKSSEYDKIIFSDLDILWTSSPNKMFSIIEDEKFYVSNENSLMSENWWGGDILNDDEKQEIKKNNVLGINAGIFGFKPKMIDHLKNIDIFLTNNQHLVNLCLEQPFFNVYLYRNKIYDNQLTNFISHIGYHLTEYDGIALHFAGGPGNFVMKYEKMINFYNKNFK
jgi:hypothetical protein